MTATVLAQWLTVAASFATLVAVTIHLVLAKQQHESLREMYEELNKLTPGGPDA